MNRDSRPTVEQVELIIDTMADMGFEDAETYENYSGRGMYGEQCVAITGDGDDRGVFLAIGALCGTDELDIEVARDWFRRSDSMGLGWVRY